MLNFIKKKGIVSSFLALLLFISIITIIAIMTTKYESDTGRLHFVLGPWPVRIPAGSLSAGHDIILHWFYIAMIVYLCLFTLTFIIGYRKPFRALYIDCDPPRFLEGYRPIYEEFARMKLLQNGSGLAVFIHYSQGLFEAGDVNGAIAVVEKLFHLKALDSPRNAMIKCMANLSLLRYSYYAGERPEDLARYLAEIEAICEGTFVKNRKTREALEICRYKARLLNHLNHGEYEEALALYSDIPYQTGNNCGFAVAQARLAVIRSALGDSLKAADCLKQAIQTGPKLFSVLEAKRKIFEEEQYDEQ